MIRKAYKVVQNPDVSLPWIDRVGIEDMAGVSWREAKKQLRDFYMKKAREVRAMREKDLG